MKRRSWSSLLIIHFALWPQIVLSQQKENKNPDIVTIGSYNVENLWDGVANNTPNLWRSFKKSLSKEDRYYFPRQLQYRTYSSGSSNWYSPEILMAKIQNTVEGIIFAGQPDILALQEIESSGNKSQIWTMKYSKTQTFKEKLQELGYSHFIIGQQDPKNPVAVTTAFISKYPIKSLPEVRINFPTKSTSDRDIQVIEAQFSGNKLIAFNTHWKSKWGGNDALRIYTAKKLRERVLSERKKDPHADIVVLGDLNTAYFERPMITLGATGNKRKMLKVSLKSLYNLWYDLRPNERWEHSFNGVRSTLCHILLSDTLFDHRGLQYIDRSFRVVGHSKAEAKKLLGPNGTPFRWQISREKGKYIHKGIGYSDHLPLVASFRVIPKSTLNKNKKVKLYNPSRRSLRKKEIPFLLDEVKVCRVAESIDYKSLDWKQANKHIGRCIKINFNQNEEAPVLKTRGLYKSTFVTLPLESRNRNKKIKINIGLAMNRSFDWRPNIDDERITLDDIKNLSSKYHSKKWDPRSNKCFFRRVLQRKGGNLRKAIGRIGYNNGYLSLFLASREKKFLSLENLPAYKEKACPWR